MRRALIAATTAAAFVANSSAFAADGGIPCVTRAEIRATVAFMAPVALVSAMSQCAKHLGARSVLTSRGPTMLADLNKTQFDAVPLVRTAMAKLGTDTADHERARADMSDTEFALRAYILTAKEVRDIVKPAKCKNADRLVQKLSALPADRLIDYITDRFIATPFIDDISVCPTD